MNLTPAIVGLGIVLASTPVVLRIAAGRFLDVPNERSSHDVPVPRIGGISVTLGLSVAIAVAGPDDVGLAIAVVSVVLAIVGFLDDRNSLPANVRLLAQLVASTAVLPFLLEGMGVRHWWTWVFGAGVVVWMSAYVNAFNFMDGINGISVAQSVVAGVVSTIAGSRWNSDDLVVLGVALAGSSAGFAPFNVPKAGCSSATWGPISSGSSSPDAWCLAIRIGVPPDVAFAPLALYLLDTSSTLLRRWRRGERLSIPIGSTRTSA